jgi:hypothetical protein
MRRLFLGVLLVMSSVTTSSLEAKNKKTSLHQQQVKAIENLAMAQALSSRCGQLRFNSFVLASVLLTHKLEAEDIQSGGRFENLYGYTLWKSGESFSKYRSDVSCDAASLVFGSKGVHIPNLLVDK